MQLRKPFYFCGQDRIVLSSPEGDVTVVLQIEYERDETGYEHDEARSYLVERQLLLCVYRFGQQPGTREVCENQRNRGEALAALQERATSYWNEGYDQMGAETVADFDLPPCCSQEEPTLLNTDPRWAW